MAFMTPGALFLGTLVPAEQKYIKQILINARQQGYTRVVEPCCGAFAMSHLAVQAGFKPEQIECSDVTMFSSIYGYGIMEKPLDDLEIWAKDFTEEECKDYATMMYALLYYRQRNTAGNDYFYSMLREMELNKQKHIDDINQYVTRARSLLKGLSYRPMDLNDHIDEVINDPHTIIIANPPTYKAGFEKWYDTHGNMTWKEPHYNIFDPETGLKELMVDKMGDAKALIICYEENEPGKTAGHPLFSRYGVRRGVNVYLTTNQEEVATALANGKTIVRPPSKPLFPLKCSMLPSDYEVKPDSKLTHMKIEPSVANYYRGIWTHNFNGSLALNNIGLFIDGKIFAVLGVNQKEVKQAGKDTFYIHYGIAVRHQSLRLNRLVTMCALNRHILGAYIEDWRMEKATKVQTTQITKYPESKEMRGLMKLVEKRKGPLGYNLIYQAPLTDYSSEQLIVEFLNKEERWKKERAKTKSQQ